MRLCFIGFFLLSTLCANDSGSYYVPPPESPGSPKTVPLMITVVDPPEEYAERTQSASFGNHIITLRPPNPTNIRGKLFTYVFPGNYTIRWTVKEDIYSNPQMQSYEKSIDIQPEAIWVDILIEGKEMEVR